MKQVKPLPPSFSLEPTLARRVQQLRDFRNITQKDLAKATKFSQQRIEDIEGAVETWLSVADRQKLAKALTVEPRILQEVERRIESFDEVNPLMIESISRQLTESILEGARDLECPRCGSTLKCSIQEGIDMEGAPTYFAKAYCLKCPFVLR